MLIRADVSIRPRLGRRPLSDLSGEYPSVGSLLPSDSFATRRQIAWTHLFRRGLEKDFATNPTKPPWPNERRREHPGRTDVRQTRAGPGDAGDTFATAASSRSRFKRVLRTRSIGHQAQGAAFGIQDHAPGLLRAGARYRCSQLHRRDLRHPLRRPMADLDWTSVEFPNGLQRRNADYKCCDKGFALAVGPRHFPIVRYRRVSDCRRWTATMGKLILGDSIEHFFSD